MSDITPLDDQATPPPPRDPNFERMDIPQPPLIPAAAASGRTVIAHPFGLFKVTGQLHVTTADVDLDLYPGEYAPVSVDEAAALESAGGSTGLIVRVKE